MPALQFFPRTKIYRVDRKQEKKNIEEKFAFIVTLMIVYYNIYIYVHTKDTREMHRDELQDN